MMPRRSSRLAAQTVAHFDWRNQGIQVLDPRIHCQVNDYCWALVAAECQAAANKLGDGDINAELQRLSVQHLIDGCADNDPENLHPNDMTYWVDTALEYIQMNGILPEDEYRPLDGKIQPLMAMTEEQSARLIRGGGCVDMYPGWGWVDMFPDNINIDENEVMRMVQRCPLYGVMQITDDFQHFSGDSIFTGMYTKKAKDKEKRKIRPQYHAIIVTGFGKLDDGRTFWNIKNSWGETWGDGGFAKVARPSSLRGRVERDKHLIENFGYALPAPPPPPVND